MANKTIDEVQQHLLNELIHAPLDIVTGLVEAVEVLELIKQSREDRANIDRD